MATYDPSIFRAYDVRGIYPTQMNEQVAYAAGQAFVVITGAKRVVVGRDVRSTGESIQAALIQGVRDTGATAIEVGVISTEMLYFAAGTLDCDGGMSVTASHNPAEWNGIKFIGQGAIPLTREGQLGEIYDFIRSGREIKQFEPGPLEHEDLLSGYIAFLKKFTPTDLPPLKVVINTNFGANGKIVDKALEGLPIEVTRLNWPEDGTFPKGTPDPLLPKNRIELSETIVREGANFGVAFDADADRAFFYDEQGRPFHGYYIGALLSSYFLKNEPGATIVYDPRLTWAVEAAVAEGHGTAYLSKTGHGYIKQSMRAQHAIYGLENSGHFYYRDFFGCDCGMLTFLLVAKLFGEQIKAGHAVSEILDQYQEQFPSSDELNYITDKAIEIVGAFKEKYANAKIGTLDGVSIEYPDFRFNVRLSNNEPIMRLNLEAKTPELLTEKLAEVNAFIESYGATLRNDG